MPAVEIGLLGAGAIGSRVAALLPRAFGCTVVDNQHVLPENLDTSRFEPEDCFRPKATVTAARRGASAGGARALHGDVRYAVRPGLVRALDAVLLCLDNPTAIRDVTEAVWDAGIAGIPLLVLTCGNAATRGGYQVRLFLAGRDRACPCCLWGQGERDADRRARGASCAVTTAPRASASAAEAAAEAGVRVLLRWLDGDRGAVGARVQRDGDGAEYVIRMPASPVAGCPVSHHPETVLQVDLGGGIDAVTVGAVAERAIAEAGDDAQILLGRRAVPMMGLTCPRCRVLTAAPLRLLPAATSSRQCECPGTLQPLATRSQVGAHELVAPDSAGLTLRQFGSGPGEELLAVGSRGAVLLRTSFEWGEIA